MKENKMAGFLTKPRECLKYTNLEKKVPRRGYVLVDGLRIANRQEC